MSDFGPMDWLHVVTRDVPLNVGTISTTLLLLGILWLAILFLRQGPEGAISFTLPTPEQCRAEWRGKVLDEPVIKVSGSTAIQCYSPTTGELLGLVNPTTPDGIDRSIFKANECQSEWAKTTFAQRRRVLKTLLKFILDQQDSIAWAACRDSGKTRVDALFGEVLVTAEKLRWTIDHGEKALASERRPTNFLMFYKRNEVRYEPMGVVAACVSWKYVSRASTFSNRADATSATPFTTFSALSSVRSLPATLSL